MGGTRRDAGDAGRGAANRTCVSPRRPVLSDPGISYLCLACSCLACPCHASRSDCCGTKGMAMAPRRARRARGRGAAQQGLVAVLAVACATIWRACAQNVTAPPTLPGSFTVRTCAQPDAGCTLQQHSVPYRFKIATVTQRQANRQNLMLFAPSTCRNFPPCHRRPCWNNIHNC